jgi:hypothetical protein
MVLLRYALLGEKVLLSVGAPVTVNALVPVVTTTVVGLLIVTSMPALPSRVPDPITTAINKLDNTVQDAHATPEEGGEPTLALQV